MQNHVEKAKSILLNNKLDHVREFERMANDTTRQPFQEQIELNKTFLNEDSTNDLNAAKGQNTLP